MNIKDIAQICGVSSSTVSKVLHNKDDNISMETRKKVLSAIKEYNYVPYSKVINSTAARMNLIAVFMDDESCQGKELLCGIEQAAFQSGYTIIICNTSGEEKKKDKYIQILENKGINGIIVCGESLDERKKFNVPVVSIVDAEHISQKKTETCVSYSMKEAGYQAAEFLFSKKHKNIACFLSGGDRAVETGYLKFYGEQMISPNKEWVFYWDEETADEVLRDCLQTKITAVVCSDIYIGKQLCIKLTEQGLNVPEDISIICVRNHEALEYLTPPMTSVRIPVSKLAEQAVGALLEMMEERKPGYECERKVKLEICERNSVAVPKRNKTGEKIVVVGNMNMDYNLIVEHMPLEGVVAQIKNSIFFSGGKGGNQAVGARKLGGLVYMIGCLGRDNDGKEIYNSLLKAGVRMDGVKFQETTPTGRAYITIDAYGESSILIDPGANQILDSYHIEQCEKILDGAKFCLISAELPKPTVEYTINMCRQKGICVMMKPSLTEKIEDGLLSEINYLIPNEKEAEILLPGVMSVEERAAALFEKGVQNVIITLGAKGCFLKNKDYSRHFPAANLQAVDTTGAADAFISALTVYLSEDYGIIYAIQMATYAAGISVTRFGVQEAMVTREILDAQWEITP